jgi:ubiquitin-conjugating enzyme E2 S
LIVPNPESALNEEAGRLLLERYEDYASHARLITSIHAKALDDACSSEASATTTLDQGESTTTTTTTTTSSSGKKKVVSQKKRALKRL